MKPFYFTCGQSHSHDMGDGRVWDKNGVLEILASSWDLATFYINANFGRNWCNQYDSIESVGMDFYPNGIVETLAAK